MTYNEKKSLYESIMKDVAKIVKRKINENEDYDNDLISHWAHGNLELKCGLRDEYLTIIGGIDYISENDSMRNYFFESGIKYILGTKKIATICTDGENIYYNGEFMTGLSDVEQAFAILHCCAHINMLHHANNIEENIELDKKVNRYLEDRWPLFRGLTKKLNGFI